jgi:acetyl esterase/lipase
MKPEDIAAMRNMPNNMMAAMQARQPRITGVRSLDRKVPGPSGGPDVAIRIYEPVKRPKTLPALLWMHGGGYMLGNIDQEDLSAKRYTLAGKCVTVTVEYRLAPENPFPAPLEDCYAALKWLGAHAGEIGVDPQRIVIGGASAGGGLAAGLALLARDRGEVDISYQFLLFPMLDDCNTAPASETIPDTLLWTRESNRMGWRAYLGREPGGKNVSPYASACRAKDLTGLPPAYIAIGDLDLFLQEGLTYAGRLIAAGVATELHVYPGACHGFDMMAPEAKIARQANEDFYRALKKALHD